MGHQTCPSQWWGHGTGDSETDHNWSPDYDPDYDEVFIPDFQSQSTVDFWAKKGKGIACYKNVHGKDCKNYNDCGCRLLLFKGNVRIVKASLSSTRQSADRCVDANPKTACGSAGGEPAPWLLLDLGKKNLITSVTLFSVNNGGGRLKNLEVRVLRRRPRVTSSSMFRHGQVLGNFKGPAWDNQDVVIANGKNARGRYILVQKNDREALEMLEVKVITPKCQKKSRKGSDYQDYVHTTVTGKNCMMWKDWNNNKDNYGQNYCRNPSGKRAAVWCH